MSVSKLILTFSRWNIAYAIVDIHTRIILFDRSIDRSIEIEMMVMVMMMMVMMMMMMMMMIYSATYSLRIQIVYM